MVLQQFIFKILIIIETRHNQIHFNNQNSFLLHMNPLIAIEIAPNLFMDYIFDQFRIYL